MIDLQAFGYFKKSTVDILQNTSKLSKIINGKLVKKIKFAVLKVGKDKKNKLVANSYTNTTLLNSKEIKRKSVVVCR